MSLPPVTVQIKRKATDEPVDFLRVHEANGKRRRRATDFVFSRQQDPQVENGTTQAPLGVRRIKQIHRAASFQALGVQSNRAGVEQSTQGGWSGGEDFEAASGRLPSPDHDAQMSFTKLTNQAAQAIAQPRRFHISRNSTAGLGVVAGAQSKRPAKTTVFIERRVRPKLAQDEAVSSEKIGQPTPILTSVPSVGQDRPQRKPGLAKRPATHTPTSPFSPITPASPIGNVRFNSGAVVQWDVNSDRLAAEMHAYTMQEITKNLAESEAAKPGVKFPFKPTNLKFKPKKPALRYQERHPESVVAKDSEMEMDPESFVVEDEDMDDDSEYIIDTYVRIPAEVLETEEGAENFGLLVLDSQPDIDEFYREGDDSEEEDDEEEDENAEDHYTADYPDEEVESDDEYGRNPYLYRNHNASDLEEFDEDDEDDATFSDDETDRSKYPWLNKPWMTKKVLGEEEDDL